MKRITDRLRSRATHLRSRLPALLLILATLVWAACSDSEPPTASNPAMLPSDGDLVAAMQVKDRHTPRMMNQPGILGAGIGLAPNGKLRIVVYALSASHAAQANIPAHVDGVPVVTRVTGMIVARQSDPTTRARPAPVGYSVGHPDITAGTIGARVRDADGNVFILSNNHVLANSNNANIGDSALQPGPFDGGTDPADRVGTLADFQPISFSTTNLMDAAIARSSTANVGFATPSDAYGAPSSTIRSATLGMNVQKFGRTTGHTRGEVAEVDVTVEVCYVTRGPFSCAESAIFVDQFTIGPGSFSDGGDSGSLIVTDDSNKNPVGLLFAGSDTRTIANPIGPVLDRFNVTIDDGSGGSDPDPNDPPTASFTFACTGLSCSFDGTGSLDGDGSISSYAWNFGDGGTATGSNPSHTYSAAGTYTVTLTVMDNGGATDGAVQDVSVTGGSSGGEFTLSANGTKVRGRHTIDLTWSGASSTQVDVFRDGSEIATTANDGEFTDSTDNRGGATYVYQVCEAGTSTCSNEVTVTF